jgi:hypothetical protein
VENCCCEVKSWMAQNRLKLNDDKSEVLLCGSKVNMAKVSVSTVNVGDTPIAPCDSVRDLGLILDSALTLHDHVSSTVRACYFHLRTLRKLRPLLTRHAANSVAVSLILSRLDYCNCCLWGLPKQELHRLQLVQNTAARIVSRTKMSDHISPVLRELHWLPVKQRIDHKVLSLAHGCFHGSAPQYLCDLVKSYIPARPLRSSSQSRLRIPSASENHQKRTLGYRAFSNAAPLLWNVLPHDMRECESKLSFRRRLKTHLFKNL